MADDDISRQWWRDAFRIGVPVFVVIALAFLITSRFVKSAPPDHIEMSTGAPGGAYERYAKLYQAYFKRNGVTLELKPSAGDVENLTRYERRFLGSEE